MQTMERRGQLPEDMQLDLKKKTLPHLLEEAASQFPDKIAISTPDASISFRSLNEKADRLAAQLISKGIQHQSRIAVFVERCPEMIIAMFGIWKAGGIYIPVDPLMPKQRISDVIAETNPALLLSGITPTPSYLQDEVPSLSLEELISSPLPEDYQNSDSPLHPKEGAYIVFSDETTGNFKGIEINHLGVVNLVYWYRTRHLVGPGDTAALAARPCSDLSIAETAATLCNGASVKFPANDVLSNGHALIEWIENEAVSLIFLQIPLTETLIQIKWPRETPLRILFTGGDQLKKHPKQNLPFTLINNYGPAENTVISTEYRVNSDEDSLIIPIGQPIANVKSFVMDKTMQQVPHGAAGQLCLGGAGLAKGYINDEELNHKQFIVHTQLGKRPERLFLTGDLVRKRNDGKLEFLGKIDQQEALKDDRIGISAVESILNSHPAVHHAVVKLVEIGEQQTLVAYWVQTEGGHVSKQDLKRTLKKRLPAHMVPKKFIQLNQIPVGANGKICYRQLPTQQLEGETADEDDIPQNAIEKQLQSLFQQELGINCIGVHKTLFDIKATSSGSKHLLLKINQHFGKHLTLAHLLKHDSISSMAELIMTPSSQIPKDDLIEFQNKGEGGPIFCVHGLEGDLYPYYLLSKYLGSHHPVYGLPVEEEDDSIEKMAEDYVEKILRAYPSGKLNLLGFSIGSYVVLEMARLLKEKNRDVSLAGIIDTYAPHFLQKHPLLKRLQINASHFFALTAKQKKDFLIARWEDLEEKTSHIFGIKSEDNLDIIPESLKLTFQKAMSSYSPKACEVPITLILPQDESNHHCQDPSKGWKNLAGNLTIEKVQGTPQSILEIPDIKQLADIIKKHADNKTSYI